MIFKYNIIGFIVSIIVSFIILLNFNKINSINKGKLKIILSILFIIIFVSQIVIASLFSTNSVFYIISTWIIMPIGLYSLIYIILIKKL